MGSLDDIIDRYAEPYVHPHIEGAKPREPAFEHYACTRDGEEYVIAYNPVDQIAYYFFKNATVKDPLEVPISHEQRDYYIRTNYWCKDG